MGEKKGTYVLLSTIKIKMNKKTTCFEAWERDERNRRRMGKKQCHS